MLKHPFSITMFGDSMYWTDWDRNAIFQANKFTGQNASLVANSSMVSIVITYTTIASTYVCIYIKNNDEGLNMKLFFILLIRYYSNRKNFNGWILKL